MDPLYANYIECFDNIPIWPGDMMPSFGNSRELLEFLGKGIGEVFERKSISSIEEQISKKGMESAIRYLSHSYESFTDHVLAGRLYIHMLGAGMTYDNYVAVAERECIQEYPLFLRVNKEMIINMLTEHWRYNMCYDYFAAKTMTEVYYLLDNGKPFETPLLLWLRVAFQICLGEREHLSMEEIYNKTIELWEDLLMGYFTPGSPISFNSCKRANTLLSCYMIELGDSIDGIFGGFHEIAMCASKGGGVGVNFNNIRHSEISGGGSANGVFPLMRISENIKHYLTQAGRRASSFSANINIWHLDVLSCVRALSLKGNPEEHTHDISAAVFINDLFMKRVKENDEWTLFCPNKAKNLHRFFGEGFEREYLKLEAGRESLSDGSWKVVSARELFEEINDIAREKGKLSILSRDNINRKNQQSNMGLVNMTNICMEMMQYTDPETPGVCCIMSLALPKFVTARYGELCKPTETSPIGTPDVRQATREQIWQNLRSCYDFRKLGDYAARVAEHLDSVIDSTSYPTSNTKRAMMDARPIGIGVVGEADALQMMGIPQDSVEAEEFCRLYSAAMYTSAVMKSSVRARKYGCCKFSKGSPANYGLLQPDLWKRELQELEQRGCGTYRRAVDNQWLEPSKWGCRTLTIDQIKAHIQKYGMRNTLVTAFMPTATSSQIRGFSETTDARISNLFSRDVSFGGFTVLNRFLEYELKGLSCWNETATEIIFANRGSVAGLTDLVMQHPDKFPNFVPSVENVKALRDIEENYKTIWEISQKKRCLKAAIRGPYVDQSQSFNLYYSNGRREEVSYMWRLGHELGLKTISYYTLVRAKGNSSFTANKEWVVSKGGDTNSPPAENNSGDKGDKKPTIVCTDEVCYSCNG